MVRPVDHVGDPGPASHPGIVGRDIEHDLIVAAIESAGQTLVTGEAGIGKSTLLQTCAIDLERRGFRCFRATAAAGLVEHPFAALGHLLGHLPAGPAHDMGRRAVDALVDLAPGSTAVLVLDDAQLLDAWSLNAVLQARARDGPRLLVAARHTDGLNDAVLTIGRRPGRRVELQRLSAAETAQLAEVELGDPLDTASAARIHDATDGLPLAVTELVRYAHRSGALFRRAGLWRWRLGADVDPRLAELLGLRVDQLDQVARDVLDLVSVVDQLPIDVIAADRPEADLAALESQRLVAETRPGWVAPAHPLLRDACLARLEPVRRRSLLTRLVTALRQCDRTDPELDRRRVIVSIEIGEPVDADDLLATVEWGAAHGLWQPMSAVLEHAWTTLPGPRTGLAHGEALYWANRMDEAAAVFDAAERLCEVEAERVEIALARARTLNVGLGHWDEALAERARMRATVTDPALLLDVLAAEAYELVHRGEVHRVLAILHDLPTMSNPDDHYRSARYRLTQAMVGALGLAGRTHDMATEYGVHVDARPDNDEHHPLAATAVDVWWTTVGRIAGRRDLTHEVTLARHRASLSTTDGLTRPVWALPMAVDHWRCGRLDLAERLAREALGIDADVRTITRLSRHVLARVLELQGRHGEALALCAEPEPDDFFALVRDWGIGVRENCAAALTGRPLPQRARDAAIDRVLVAAHELADVGQLLVAAYLAHDTLRLGGVTTVTPQVLDLLRSIAARTDAPTARHLATHAESVAAGDPERLLGVALDAMTIGDGTTAVLVLRDALHIAMSRRLHVLATDIRQASGELNVSGWPGDEPVPSPTVVDLGLSDRELEVASAAALGLADREIAETLVVSVRTVHAHLRSVYRKLDVHRREDLVAIPGLGGADTE
jgi:DNA-binding NarL/FixJ family response regulator